MTRARARPPVFAVLAALALSACGYTTPLRYCLDHYRPGGEGCLWPLQHRFEWERSGVTSEQAILIYREHFANQMTVCDAWLANEHDNAGSADRDMECWYIARQRLGAPFEAAISNSPIGSERERLHREAGVSSPPDYGRGLQMMTALCMRAADRRACGDLGALAQMQGDARGAEGWFRHACGLDLHPAECLQRLDQTGAAAWPWPKHWITAPVRLAAVANLRAQFAQAPPGDDELRVELLTRARALLADRSGDEAALAEVDRDLSVAAQARADALTTEVESQPVDSRTRASAAAALDALEAIAARVAAQDAARIRARARALRQSVAADEFRALAARTSEAARQAPRLDAHEAALTELAALQAELGPDARDAAARALADLLQQTAGAEVGAAVAARRYTLALGVIERALRVGDPGGVLTARGHELVREAASFHARASARASAAGLTAAAFFHAARARGFGASVPLDALEAAARVHRAPRVLVRPVVGDCPWATAALAPTANPAPDAVELTVEVTRCVAEEQTSQSQEAVSYNVPDSVLEYREEEVSVPFRRCGTTILTSCNWLNRGSVCNPVATEACTTGTETVTRRVPVLRETSRRVQTRTIVRHRTLRVELAGTIRGRWGERVEAEPFDLSLPPLTERAFTIGQASETFTSATVEQRREGPARSLAAAVSAGAPLVRRMLAEAQASRLAAAAAATDENAREEHYLRALLLDPRVAAPTVDSHFSQRYGLDRVGVLTLLR